LYSEKLELGKEAGWDDGLSNVAETSVNAWDYAAKFTPSLGTPME